MRAYAWGGFLQNLWRGAGIVVVDEKYYFCMRAMRACGIAFVISAISGMTKRLYYAKKHSFIGRIYRYKATL